MKTSEELRGAGVLSKRIRLGDGGVKLGKKAAGALKGSG